MKSINGINEERKVPHSHHTGQLLSLESGSVRQAGLLWTPGLTLLHRASTNLIVIIFIDRKHHSVCGSWGQRHQFSFVHCAHYKWSNKLSLLAKNFHNWFQPEGTFLFVFKHSAILIYVNVKISTFFSAFNPIYRILFSTRKTPK